jgi:hypothetical protein
MHHDNMLQAGNRLYQMDLPRSIYSTYSNIA